MFFAKLFPTKIVPITVPPGELKYAYFSICVLLEGFLWCFKGYDPFHFFRPQSSISYLL